MEKTKKLSEEKKAKFQSLRKMMQNPLSQNLKKLTDLLTPLKNAILLEDAAQKTGISVEGIRTIHASTKNDIEIFSETKGGKEIWYVKIKKKQP